MRQEHIEAMSEILDEAGVSASSDQIKQITKDFMFHLEMAREMESHAHVSFIPVCKKCESLEYQLKEMTSQRDAYQNSVKQRRNADRVWLDGDRVMYE